MPLRLAIRDIALFERRIGFARPDANMREGAP
jgi:hypothetical protein